jgi:hypothetical protein
MKNQTQSQIAIAIGNLKPKGTKNLFKFCLIFLFSLSMSGQCNRQIENSTNLSFFYGTTETVGTTLTIIANDVMYGLGYSFYIGDVNETNVAPNQAFFTTLGYQINRISVSGIGGVNDNTFYIDGAKNKTKIEVFYGGIVGFKILDNLKLNVGYDTFNKTTFGFSLKFK